MLTTVFVSVTVAVLTTSEEVQRRSEVGLLEYRVAGFDCSALNDSRARLL